MQSVVLFGLTTVLASAGPPRHMPDDLKDLYTMGGRIEVGDMFVDDTGIDGTGTHYKYGAQDVLSFINGAERAKNKGVNLKYDNKRLWIIEALKQYPLSKGSTVAVYGSMEPWYEAVAITHGAESVVVIEYNHITYDHPQIRSVTVSECTEDPTKCQNFDYSLSMSSFDHDGLGRYGDPLNPNGDLEAMKVAMKQLKPGGILFLVVPIGPDVVVWNLHRRYGELRLPLLLEGWEVVDRIGWNEEKLTKPANWRQSYEPIFVLRKPLADGNSNPVDEL